MSRWKKIAAAVVLVVLVIIGTIAVCDLLPREEPPFQVGLDLMEAQRVALPKKVLGGFGPNTMILYDADPDWLGNKQRTEVYFDDNERVTHWASETRRSTRPLDKARKAVGW